MSSDLATSPSDATAAPPRRWSTVLLAAAAWNLWLWATRLYNLANDDVERSTGFVVVHTVLFVVSIAFAVAIGVVGWRLRRGAAR